MLESVFPELAIAFQPFGRVGERSSFDTPGAPLGVDGARNEPSAFEHFEVLGDGRLAHVEGLDKLVHCGFAGSEASKDGTARGIGESGEGGIELLGSGHCITI